MSLLFIIIILLHFNANNGSEWCRPCLCFPEGAVDTMLCEGLDIDYFPDFIPIAIRSGFENITIHNTKISKLPQAFPDTFPMLELFYEMKNADLSCDIISEFIRFFPTSCEIISQACSATTMEEIKPQSIVTKIATTTDETSNNPTNNDDVTTENIQQSTIKTELIQCADNLAISILTFCLLSFLINIGFVFMLIMKNRKTVNNSINKIYKEQPLEMTFNPAFDSNL